PSVDVILPVRLFCVPPAMPFTLTTMLHVALAAKAPPLRLMLPEAATAVTVPPLQLPTTPFGVPTTRPAGRVSVNAIPLSAVATFGFVSVKERVVVAFSAMLPAPNALLKFGEVTAATLMVAVLLVAPVPTWVEEIAPVVFGRLLPATVPVMLTETTQVP